MDKKERNAEIVKARKRGETLQVIADRHGLTREMVRIIAFRAGVTGNVTYHVLKARLMAEQAAELLRQLKAMPNCCVCGGRPKRTYRNESKYRTCSKECGARWYKDRYKLGDAAYRAHYRLRQGESMLRTGKKPRHAARLVATGGAYLVPIGDRGRKYAGPEAIKAK